MAFRAMKRDAQTRVPAGTKILSLGFRSANATFADTMWTPMTHAVAKRSIHRAQMGKVFPLSSVCRTDYIRVRYGIPLAMVRVCFAKRWAGRIYMMCLTVFTLFWAAFFGVFAYASVRDDRDYVSAAIGVIGIVICVALYLTAVL